jgi:hypothetical protein
VQCIGARVSSQSAMLGPLLLLFKHQTKLVSPEWAARGLWVEWAGRDVEHARSEGHGREMMGMVAKRDYRMEARSSSLAALAGLGLPAAA